jgi:hypothetical protein
MRKLDRDERWDAATKRAVRDRKANRRSRWRTFFVVLACLVVLFSVIRAILPWGVRKYVNRTLDRNELYEGRIGQVQVHLWRGAYSIHDVRISKRTGDVPVPFFSASHLDFAIEWKALMHRRVVGLMEMFRPEINFVDAPSEDEAQTGAGAPWLQIIRDLFPFRINSAIVRSGSVHFRAYQKETPVDVYLSEVEGTVDNLGNIRDQTTPQPATVQAKAVAMDQAKLDFKMTLDPFSYRPTFHMALRLVGLDVTKINDLALAYGKFDFKRGWFDLVIETDSKHGQLTGYVKPLFRDLKVFSLAQDIQEDNPLQFLWQALVGAATTVLRNQPRDQFGTLIPFTGDASGATQTDILATIGNVLRNAFVRAYLPRLEGNQEPVEGIQFGAPELQEHLATGGAD